MKSSEYWKKRSEEVAQSQYDKADTYEASLRREYQRATDEIQRSIEVFYQRYAINDEISLAEARKLLTGKELKGFRMTLEEFTAKAKDNADGRWTQLLNSVYYRTRVSRLEALQLQIRQQVEMLAGSRQHGAHALLSDIYEDTYYRNMYELQKGTGFGVSFAKLNSEGIDKVLTADWVGSNYSKRIWGDRDKLINELRTKLTQSFIRGETADRTIRDLVERMDVSKSNAERLIQTESSFITHQATADGYRESNIVKQYEILATLDRRTSDICRSMDGHEFNLSEMEVGVNYPPFHARCRTTVVPYFPDEIDPGERVARDDSGNTYFVPGNIAYPEWKKNYVDSTDVPKSGIIKPIEFRMFSNEAEVKKWVDDVTPAWLVKLPDNEAAAITTYTGSSYHNINKNLRNGGGDDYYDNLAKEISSGISKFTLQDSIIVYRGLDKDIFGVPAEKLPGAIIEENGFTSTTLLSDKAFTGSYRLELRVPSGVKGAPVSPISQFKLEYEFLFDKGLRYKIIEVEQDIDTIIIKAEVLEDD